MTSRERVLAAFRFEPTDRFPLDIMENNIWPTLFNYFHNTYGLNSDEEILTIIYQENDLEFTCTKLVQAANEKGGIDNISVILARTELAGKENPIL